jgi:hypothetical protein
MKTKHGILAVSFLGILAMTAALAIPPNKATQVEQAARDLRDGNERLPNEADVSAYATGLMSSNAVSIMDLSEVDDLQELRDAFNAQTIQTIASATATPLGTATSEYVVISGTTTITSFTTATAGVRRLVRFSGALTLTHNATTLILPGAANITTVAGDTALFVSEGSGNWRALFYAPTTVTGTGGQVKATSPTLVTPVLGVATATSVQATNIGNVTPGAGAFTTLSSSGAYTPTGGVAAAGGFAVSARLVHSGGVAARVNTDGTDATPSVSETYFCEVFVPANMSVTGVSVFLGSATEGNVKVGLANSNGVVVATSASTDASGATVDAYFRVAFTAPYAAVGPATYYVLLLNDNTGNRFNTHTFGDFVAGKKTGETYATGFTTITPGSTFTTALGPMASLY